MITQIIHESDGSASIRFSYDPVFIATLKNEVPAWARTYDPSTKEWSIHHAYKARVEQLARQRFGFVEVHGDSSERVNHSCSCDDAHRMLHVCQDAPLEVVKAAYRALARVNHPDNGGDHSQMIALTEAYERAIGGAR